jgi:hypothetical protein
MFKIYKIEDINDLCYYGKTKNTMTRRFCNHICDYRNHNGKCSSSQLNLYNSTYFILEDNLSEEEAKEREIYYIQNFECVNKIKYNMDDKKSHAKYRSNIINKEKETKSRAKWYYKNKDTINKNKRENKQYWYCEDCNCKTNLNHKSRHCKTNKHLKNMSLIKL